jgi:hypothetical protein
MRRQAMDRLPGCLRFVVQRMMTGGADGARLPPPSGAPVADGPWPPKTGALSRMSLPGIVTLSRILHLLWTASQLARQARLPYDP